jgi:pimeloyl-ACP methyl ester carboxylesterase
MMEKGSAPSHSIRKQGSSRLLFRLTAAINIICFAFFYHAHKGFINPFAPGGSLDSLWLSRKSSPYGQFPRPNDPFHFLPCTNISVLPALNDTAPEKSWARLFDPNPAHWIWGNKTINSIHFQEDAYLDRPIYMCGYLNAPLDYTNKSDPRIVRLAVTKLQVSGLSPIKSCHSPGNQKSERTIVIEPGGPGGSGTFYTFRAAEEISNRLSDGKFDVIGWDPRGVNASLPAVSCFPYDADRDRWSLLTQRFREASPSPTVQLELADTMNDAIFKACLARNGDFARFVGTSFVARDMEEIRKALKEEELTGYLVSYGTGIGQTYANIFPDSVGRLILDGTEYVRDHRLLGGFGWTALDNATDAWHDGFLRECLNAGPQHCSLAKPKGGKNTTLQSLADRMENLITSLIARPMAGYAETSGPLLITYSPLVSGIYGSMYNAKSWPALAQMLYELESGNTTLASMFFEQLWDYHPSSPAIPGANPSSEELGTLVICADSYDAPQQKLEWWGSLWTNMTEKSWVSGNQRFYYVLPCRHFNKYWSAPAGVYRGDLNHTLRHPVLLIAETYDPATPLRNGRRLLVEMGENARLIVHHGYGHSSRDTSNCTDSIAKAFILNGTLPAARETACYADEKPYLYGVNNAPAAASVKQSPIEVWKEHLQELALWNPLLLR